MNVIGIYREMVGISDKLKSIQEDSGLIDKNIAEKAARYLSSGIPVIDFMEATYDPFDKNAVISGGSSLLSDGHWVWRVDLAYLVEKYCLWLPDELISEVVERSVVDQSLEAEVLEKSEAIYKEYERIRQGNK